MGAIVKLDQTANKTERSESNDLIQAFHSLQDLVQVKLRLSDIFRTIHKRMNQGDAYENILSEIFTSLRSVIPHERMGIGMIDDGRVSLRWAKSSMLMENLKFGYSAELKGSSLEHILATQNPRIINDLEQYYRDHPNSKSTALALKDGIKSSLTCPLIIDGKPIGFIFFSSLKTANFNESHVGIFKEISEAVSIVVEQGLLRQSIRNSMNENANRETVLRSVVHDLNNPLSVISGFLSELSSQDWFANLDEDSRAIFQTLQRKCEMMIGLVGDLSEINKLKEPDAISPTLVSLDDFLKELEMSALALSKGKDIRVIVKRTPFLPGLVRFDRNQIMRVIENLVSNALKYSFNYTIIEIEVRFLDSRLYFSVHDQGQGIPPGEFHKLFKEFGKTSVKPVAGASSTGLGLAIVKRIVEAHHGEITVKSTPGIGSSFTFWIPITSQQDSKST